MKIARVRWTAYRIPFRAPYVTAAGAATHREGLIVDLIADDGRIGLGEAALVPESDDAASLEPILFALAPSLLGRDADRSSSSLTPGTGEPENAVRCALDTALCDLRAQLLRVPLAGLLTTGAPRPEVAVNALVTIATLEGAVRAATEARLAGYSTVKLKVGTAPDLDAERGRVAAVRDAIGPGVKLRLDPNGAWSVEQAIATINALEEYDIEYVEQPIAPRDIEALRRVQAAVATPIAADEDVTGIEAARRILEARAARVLVLKPQRIGGLAASASVIEAAADAGVRCVVTTSIETGVGTAACLHLAASLPAGSPACGLATASLLESDLTKAPLPVVDGRMRLPYASGLGIELDDAAIARYTDGWRELP